MRYIPALIVCLIAGCLGSMAIPDSPLSSFPGRLPRCSMGYPCIMLQGGCISPTAANDNIRLDDMLVTIRCKRDSYSVDGVYHLFNTGQTATEKVGVPKFVREEVSRCQNLPVVDLRAFDGWVNGRKVEFAEVRHFFTDQKARPIGGYCERTHPSAAETLWMTKEVAFAGKATTTIRIRYEAFYQHDYSHVGSPRDVGFYHLTTARHWKGKVARAAFIIDESDTRSGPFGAPGWAVTTTILRDEMRDFEPTPGCYVEILGTQVLASWARDWDGPAPKPCSERR